MDEELWMLEIRI